MKNVKEKLLMACMGTEKVEAEEKKWGVEYTAVALLKELIDLLDANWGVSAAKHFSKGWRFLVETCIEENEKEVYDTACEILSEFD